MEIKDLEKILQDALDNSSNDSMKNKYIDSLVEYLKTHKSSDELITLVVRGINIDYGANYFESIEFNNKNDIQSLWKQVRENKEIKSNKKGNGLKFVTGLLALAFTNKSNTEKLCGNLMAKVISMIESEKNVIPTSEYETIIMEFFVEDVCITKQFPKWELFGLSGKTSKSFAELIEKLLSAKTEEKYQNMLKWATIGVSYSERKIETEKIEAKIPESKITDLQNIIAHYQMVEKQVHDDEYEIARLNGEIEKLHKDIAGLNLEKNNLNKLIQSLNDNIEEKNKKIEDAEKEISERKTLNDAFSELKKNDEQGILNDIADDLKITYGQIKRSEDTEMSVELGSIYRGMLKNVFKTLEKHGIRLE